MPIQKPHMPVSILLTECHKYCSSVQTCYLNQADTLREQVSKLNYMSVLKQCISPEFSTYTSFAQGGLEIDNQWLPAGYNGVQMLVLIRDS